MAPPTKGGPERERLIGNVIEALEAVPSSDWELVLEVLRRQELPDQALDSVIQESAKRLGFWSLDVNLLGACRRALRLKLAKPFLGKDPSMTVMQTPIEQFKGVVTGTVIEPVSDTICRQISDESCIPAKREPSKSAPFSRQISDERKASKLSIIEISDERKASKLSIMSKLSTASFARQISGESKASKLSIMSKISTLTGRLMKSHSICWASSNASVTVPKDLEEQANTLSKEERFLMQDEAASRLKQFKWALFIFVAGQMLIFAIYVVFYMTPKTWDIIGLPILIARGSAYGACFWTALLFLTMSRDFIAFIVRAPCVRNSQLLMQLINCHKEIHIFSAWEVLLDGIVHALMHHIGTFVALEKNDAATLNSMMVCAQHKANLPDGYIGKAIGNFLEVFQHPRCPLPEGAKVGYLDGVLSTPGITGYLLLLVICLLGWFSRAKRRRASFRWFYAMHHLLVPCWVILLVLHGANDWVGLGFPLVLIVAGIPLALYAWTRIRRVYLSLGTESARLISVNKSENGKLLRLEVELGSRYRSCMVGEFAYINVPAIGRTEWHPYTICNSKPGTHNSQVITFCVMSVGKWTKKLHACFQPGLDWPNVHIDGPFYAPTVSMPQRSTVVGIGAGVGVTPFLSFLGSVAQNGGGEHKRAHVFWMSAFATDFLLFRDLFSQLEEGMKRSRNFLSFHLHATPNFGAWNGKGVGCVFDLVAREVWTDWSNRLSEKDSSKVPTFCTYPKPLHAVISSNILASGTPLAVAVGSPNWIAELLAIGDADRAEDVFVYFCGNDFLKNMIRSACIACNRHRTAQGEPQRYYFYFERFG